MPLQVEFGALGLFSSFAISCVDFAFVSISSYKRRHCFVFFIESWSSFEKKTQQLKLFFKLEKRPDRDAVNWFCSTFYTALLNRFHNHGTACHRGSRERFVMFSFKVGLDSTDFVDT